jgi:hypothetical protein
MRTGISITFGLPDRLRLEAMVCDRNAAQKHVWRAAIILFSADGLGTLAIMRRTGKSPSTASSPRPTKTPNLSHGPAIPTGSSPPSKEGTKC